MRKSLEKSSSGAKLTSVHRSVANCFIAVLMAKQSTGYKDAQCILKFHDMGKVWRWVWKLFVAWFRRLFGFISSCWNYWEICCFVRFQNKRKAFLTSKLQGNVWCDAEIDLKRLAIALWFIYTVDHPDNCNLKTLYLFLQPKRNLNFFDFIFKLSPTKLWIYGLSYLICFSIKIL